MIGWHGLSELDKCGCCASVLWPVGADDTGLVMSVNRN